VRVLRVWTAWFVKNFDERERRVRERGVVTDIIVLLLDRFFADPPASIFIEPAHGEAVKFTSLLFMHTVCVAGLMV
jgi:hypothetical protein